MTATATPEYDALCETIANGVAYGREHGGIHPVTVGLMKIRGKAITSGQRAGERAFHNVCNGASYRSYIAADRDRAHAAAAAAASRARERYAIKALTA